jgi:DNA-directed RNA polymerase specialized sigma24 family protein
MPSNPFSRPASWISAGDRSPAKPPAYSDDGGTPGADEESRSRDQALVLAALDGMSPSDYEVLRLSIGIGFDAAELAVTLGVSVRRAQTEARTAIARFDSRSIAVILTSRARID